MIKVCIADDHDLFREGVELIISEEEMMVLNGSFRNGVQLINHLKTNLHNLPDIVLMDISMPEKDGIETTELMQKLFPKIKIIVLTMFDDEEHYYKMINLGVKGFILKKSGSSELVNAIVEVFGGGNYFSQELLQKIIISYNKKSQSKIELSQREQEVLILICNGFTNNEIGEKLFISPKTADNHRTSLLQKTKTKNSAHLVMYAMKNNLVEI